MAETAERIHPLQNRAHGNNGVSLVPVEACERISLRAETKALNALGRAIGVTLPKKPRTTATKNDISALWIGPDEWFIIGPDGSDLEKKLNLVKTGLYSAVAINHRNTAITISGPNAINTLNSGCPRDLSIEAFPAGGCSRTILAKAEIILWRKSEDEFHIECWRSFSDYVWKYLVDAARSA